MRNIMAVQPWQLHFFYKNKIFREYNDQFLRFLTILVHYKKYFLEFPTKFIDAWFTECKKVVKDKYWLYKDFFILFAETTIYAKKLIKKKLYRKAYQHCYSMLIHLLNRNGILLITVHSAVEKSSLSDSEMMPFLPPFAPTKTIFFFRKIPQMRWGIQVYYFNTRVECTLQGILQRTKNTLLTVSLNGEIR